MSTSLSRSTSLKLIAPAATILAAAMPAMAEDIEFDTVPATWALHGMADLDGDGRDELIWSAPVASPPGTRDYHAMSVDLDGEPASTVFFYQAVGGAWSMIGTDDFDGDGKDDLFWRNVGTGRSGLFLMNGTTPSWRSVNTPAGTPVVLDASWTANAFGDLDGDGRAEVIWRPTGTGYTRAWFLQVNATAAILVADETIGQPLSSSAWLLMAATDAGGDGRDDLFWSSLSPTNRIGWLYEMNGTTITYNIRLDPPTSAHFPDDPPGEAWHMAAVGDLDGDGLGDVSWRSAPTGLRRVVILDRGSFVRYERYASNYPGPSRALAVGDIDGDQLADAAFSDTGGTLPTLHRYLTPIRGVNLRPETFYQDGSEVTERWIPSYLEPGIREQVLEELSAIRDVAGFTHVWIPLAPGRDFSWPIPTSANVDIVAAILNDVNTIGLKAMISIPTWCQLSEEQVATTGGINFDHVGGHCEGEIVNGLQLAWDCPPCMEDWPFQCGWTPPSSPGTYLVRVLRYYDEILPALYDAVDDPRVVEYVVINGHPGLFFGGESNLFRPNFQLKAEVAQYFQTVIPHVRSLTNWRLGVGLQPENPMDPETIGYGFVNEWLEVMDISEIDFMQITIPSYVDAQQMLAPILPEDRHKIVLTDFKAHWQDANGPLDPLPLAEVMSQALEEVWGEDMRGWWLWTYKSYPGQGFVGLREYSGIPGQTNQNNNVGWDEDALDVIEYDLGYRP